MENPRPISEFDMKEIYRLIRNDRIPGFNMLGSERRYLNEYREALRLQMEAESEKTQAKEVPVEKKTSKRRKNTRKKSIEEPKIEFSEISEESEQSEEIES